MYTVCTRTRRKAAFGWYHGIPTEYQSSRALAGRLGGWFLARSLHARKRTSYSSFSLAPITPVDRRTLRADVKKSEQRSRGAAKPDRAPSIAHIARHTHAHTVTVVRTPLAATQPSHPLAIAVAVSFRK